MTMIRVIIVLLCSFAQWYPVCRSLFSGQGPCPLQACIMPHLPWPSTVIDRLTPSATTAALQAVSYR